MNYYILLTLLVAGGIIMSFAVSFSFYYQQQYSNKILHQFCPTMSESCLNTISIEPVLPTLSSLGFVTYMIVSCSIIINHKSDNQSIERLRT